MIRASFLAGMLTLPVAVGVEMAARGGPPSVQGGVQKTALVTVVAPPDGPIKDLAAREFIVREDNSTREVTGAELSAEPLFISILVDTSQPAIGVPPPIQDLRNALSTFVKTIQAASPDAQISIMEFGGAAVPTVPFSAKYAELEKGILRLVPDPRVGSVLLEALVDAGKALSDKPTPRRAIVSIDFDSQETSSLQPKRVSEDVHKSGASVWGISIRQSTSSTMAPAREAVLKDTTQRSGGMRLTAVGPSALESMLKGVANSLLSQYTVSYMRPASANVKSIKAETTRGAKVLMTPWLR